MKIRDAKQIYGAQLDALQERKRTLSKLLKEQETGAPGAPAFEIGRASCRERVFYSV